VCSVDVVLNRKVTFITGAGSGIGHGLALEFARGGSAVVVTDVDGVAAAAVAAETEVKTVHPEVYVQLGPGETWTAAAEPALFEATL